MYRVICWHYGSFWWCRFGFYTASGPGKERRDHCLVYEWMPSKKFITSMLSLYNFIFLFVSFLLKLLLILLLLLLSLLFLLVFGVADAPAVAIPTTIAFLVRSFLPLLLCRFRFLQLSYSATAVQQTVSS